MSSDVFDFANIQKSSVVLLFSLLVCNIDFIV